MAKATATCTCKTCGRAFDVTRDVFNARERESAIAYMHEHYTECPECHKARMAVKSADKAHDNGWAQLTGSDKQIAWAMEIREKMIDSVLHYVRPDAMDTAKAIITEITAKHADARWWIDHRDDNRALMQEMADAANK